MPPHSTCILHVSMGSESNSSETMLQQSDKLQGRWVENCSNVLTLRSRTRFPQTGIDQAVLGWVLSHVPPASLLLSMAEGVWGR